MAMTPKAALIKDGTVPTIMGRGRLSKAQDARCRELSVMGWDIEKYSSSTPVGAPAPVVTKAVANNEKIIADFTIHYPEDKWQAKDTKGKRVGMREVCNNCRVSLVQCTCGAPTVLGDIAVKIVRIANT